MIVIHLLFALLQCRALQSGGVERQHSAIRLIGSDFLQPFDPSWGNSQGWRHICHVASCWGSGWEMSAALALKRLHHSRNPRNNTNSKWASERESLARRVSLGLMFNSFCAVPFPSVRRRRSPSFTNKSHFHALFIVALLGNADLSVRINFLQCGINLTTGGLITPTVR